MAALWILVGIAVGMLVETAMLAVWIWHASRSLGDPPKPDNMEVGA